MLKYVTDLEYQELLGVDNTPDNFNKLVIDASNYINYHTYNRIDEENVSEQVKYVTCLIINLLVEKNKKIDEVKNLKSENVEGWSKSYATPEEITSEYENEMYLTLKTYLSNEYGKDNLPLLYCGVY